MACIITLGRVVRGSRKSHGISQREFCELVGEQFGIFLDFMEFSKIENDRIDIRVPEYDWFILASAEIFELDIEWLEIIRQQTEPQSRNPDSQSFHEMYTKEGKS
jgi:transcriptional regulator with XRE-family HTH domain